MCSYSFVSVSVPPSLPPLLPSPLCACAVMAPRRAFPAGPNCLQFFLSFFPWCSAARVSRRERESGRKSGTTAAQRKTNGILTTHTVVYNKFFFACCCSPTFWLFVMIFRHFCQCFLRGAFHFSLPLPFSCPSFPPPPSSAACHTWFLWHSLCRHTHWKWGDNQYTRTHMLLLSILPLFFLLLSLSSPSTHPSLWIMYGHNNWWTS